MDAWGLAFSPVRIPPRSRRSYGAFRIPSASASMSASKWVPSNEAPLVMRRPPASDRECVPGSPSPS